MHLALLLGWIAIAAILRFTHLATKPVWADEFSTLIFSLGNSYRTIPLNQVLTLPELLQPLQPNPGATVQSVIQNLLTESNHPPFYFALSHLWLKLFPTPNGFVSVEAARALSALFGVVSVPALFGLAWVMMRSRLVAHLAAALMAFSPFGIYLAQEARHYTLALLWVIASLGCLVVAVKHLQVGKKIPFWLCFGWIAVNGFGVATHFFVILAIVSQAIALLIWWLLFKRVSLPVPSLSVNRWRLLTIGLGTFVTIAIWLPVLLGIKGTELTRWLQAGEFDNSNGIDQLLRSLAGLVSMLYLLPIQGIPIWVAIISSGIIGVLLIWTLPLLWRGWSGQAQTPETRSMLLLIGGYVMAEIALSLFITFGLGTTFSSVFRYRFVCFPGVILLVAVALSYYEKHAATLIPRLKTSQIQGTVAIVIVLLFTFLGGLTVVNSLAYQRTHRPDQVAAAIHADFRSPTLVAIPQRTHGHTGRLMGIAWELQRLDPAAAGQTSFLLAHQPQADVTPAIAALKSAVDRLPRPLDVWRVNYRSAANPRSDAMLRQAGCTPNSKLLSVDGYRYQQYRCRA